MIRATIKVHKKDKEKRSTRKNCPKSFLSSTMSSKLDWENNHQMIWTKLKSNTQLDWNELWRSISTFFLTKNYFVSNKTPPAFSRDISSFFSYLPSIIFSYIISWKRGCVKNKNAPKEIILTHFAANEKEVAYGSNYEGKKEITEPRTSDARRGNRLHCTAENPLQIPNF